MGEDLSRTTADEEEMDRDILKLLRPRRRQRLRESNEEVGKEGEGREVKTALVAAADDDVDTIRREGREKEGKDKADEEGKIM